VGIAYDRLLPLTFFEQERWRFRVTDTLRREKLPAGWAHVGTLRFTFDYGHGGTRVTDLALRLPAVDRAQ
jgi:hypothetical protein